MAKMLWWPLIQTSILVETNHGYTTPGLFRIEKKSHKPWYTLLLTPSIPTCQRESRQFSLSVASIKVICVGNVPENVCQKIAATNRSLNISLTFKAKNHLYRRLLKLWATSVSSSQNSAMNWTLLSSFGELSRSIFMVIVIILLTLWKRTCQKLWNLSQPKPSSIGSIACFSGWKHIAQVWALQRLNNRWKFSVQQLTSHTDKF